MKKLISIILLSLYSNICLAQTSTSTSGQFSILRKGDPALYDGVLFDPYAIAIILTENDTKEEQYKIKLEYELRKQEVQYQLEINNLKIDLRSQEESSKSIIGSKNKELKELRDIAINSNNYEILYIIGGFLGGVAITGFSVWAAGHLK